MFGECGAEILLDSCNAAEAADQQPIASDVFAELAVSAGLGNRIVKLQVELDRPDRPVGGAARTLQVGCRLTQLPQHVIADEQSGPFRGGAFEQSAEFVDLANFVA